MSSRKRSFSISYFLNLQVVNAFIYRKVVPKKHICLFTATKDEDLCTFEGMRKSFQEIAGDVGENGLFIFQFSGHGLNLEKRSSGQFGLVPADFDETMATFITGSVLNQWLIDSKCKARHVVFILDCCYAGGLGNDVTAGVPNLRSGLYVLSASTAFEASLVIQPLGNSLFTYFLAYAIRKFRFVTGTLPISRIFDECRELCIAVSSLMVSYHGPHCGLQFDKFRPELQFFDVTTGSTLGNRVSTWIEESLGGSSIGAQPHQRAYLFSKFSFALKYYKTQKWWMWWREKGHDLSELCRNWLEFTSGSLSPLSELASRGLLNNEVLRAAVCLVMWSIASIEVAAKHHKSAIDPNMFLVGFLYTAAALDSFQSSPLTLNDLEEAWGFYQAVVEKHDLDDSKLRKIHKTIERDLEAEKEKETEKVKLECPPDAARRIKPDGGIVVQEKAKSGGQKTTLEPIAEDSASVARSNELAETQNVEPLDPAGPTSLEAAEEQTSYRTVDIPELATLSSNYNPGSSIVPSLRRECVLSTLMEECKIPPELLDDHTVVANSLVLQTLQVTVGM